jgi:Ca2+-transporting ATPase
MLVTGVGVNSEWGKTLAKLTEDDGEEDETPLQEKLSSLAELIGKIGVVFAVLTFQFLTIGWLIAKSIFYLKKKLLQQQMVTHIGQFQMQEK